ncbi:MAG: hypothetical protein PHR77_11225 [Kiritimatiellae bacterium]|nr:hypothetical protein [Kiritimatiellia bacterium]MDD5521702.1 hypothetical protein [Kiritimatiellia bacterium]
MKLVISIDVEEDGLFCGQYPETPPGVTNVKDLNRLDFIWDKFDIPLTLLVSYPVACNDNCASILKRMMEKQGAEVGAHLHPWCTPPFIKGTSAEPARTGSIPAETLRSKMETLTTAISSSLGVSPRAFRAGQFDLSPRLLHLLPEFGIEVDSSVVPLHRFVDGPADHFTSPPDPFTHPLNPSILEVPLTVVAVWPAAANAVGRLAPGLPSGLKQTLFAATRYINAAGIHPVWFPLASMKLAVRLHEQRGGKILNMFMHSSELCPGATPFHRTEQSVLDFVDKIRKFISWLVSRYPVEGMTLSRLVPVYRTCKHAGDLNTI